MRSYLITYRKKRRREDALVEMPTTVKLLDWISKNAHLCSIIMIQVIES